ncbi:MAG: O-antigen ligase family protein [Lentisphaerae bacterium]|nr:O-antigen ligase family protein [Lentisphaerota bacterium]
MESKYIIFLLVALLGVPLGMAACLVRPALTRWVVMLMVWATCEPNMVGINFVSREFYRANTRGFEVTLADLCALVLAGFMLVKRKDYPPRWIPPMAIPTLLYLLVGFVSWTMAGPSLPVPPVAIRVPYEQFEVGLYPLFELFKIMRGYLLFWVIVNYARSDRAARDLLWGIGAAVLYMGYLALASRYLHGVHRVQATLGHPNSLATYMAMLGSFSFAFVLFSGKWLSSMFWGFLTALSAIGVILTISRGGLAALLVGVWVNAMALLPRHLNVKNMALLLLGVLMAGVVLAIAMDTLSGRFVGEQNAAKDMEYRGKYNDQAKLMAQDHAFGVGLGNFSAWSWSRYAEIVDPDLPPGTPAHNNWYLTLGEMGWPGVFALALLWGRYFLLLIPFYLRGKKDLLATLALAGCTAILVNHVQSLLQLGYRQTPMFSMTMIFMGVGVAAWYAKRGQGKASDTRPALEPVYT